MRAKRTRSSNEGEVAAVVAVVVAVAAEWAEVQVDTQD